MGDGRSHPHPAAPHLRWLYSLSAQLSLSLSQIHIEFESLAQERVADQILYVLDHRDFLCRRPLSTSHLVHFESSVIPFICKIAFFDTYKIWNSDDNLRADKSLVGFDGLKIQRDNLRFLFLSDSDQSHDIPSGSLLVLNRDDQKIFDAFENARSPMSDFDITGFCFQTSVNRPGMDITRAELVGRANWRRQEIEDRERWRVDFTF